MNNEPIKITNLASLQQEKQRLKMLCSYQENLLKDKINFVKQHPGQLFSEEFLPYDAGQNSKINSIMDVVNEFVFEKLFGLDLNGKNKLSGVLIKLSEVMIVRLFNSFKK